MANEDSAKTWESYESMSLGRWGRKLAAGEFPGMETLQLGAILRAANALELLGEQGHAVIKYLRRAAELLEAGGDSFESPEAKAKREKAEREKASRERAWAAYVRAGGAAVGNDDADLVMRNLSVRARRVLYRLNCKTLNALAEFTADDLFEQPNCGPTTVEELRQALARVGLQLRGE